jgi:hypothetical protein
VQAASRGHAVFGDWLYGSTIPFGPQATDEREGAIALHARSLTFRHPTTGEAYTVSAELPEAWLMIERFQAIETIKPSVISGSEAQRGKR